MQAYIPLSFLLISLPENPPVVREWGTAVQVPYSAANNNAEIGHSQMWTVLVHNKNLGQNRQINGQYRTKNRKSTK